MYLIRCVSLSETLSVRSLVSMLSRTPATSLRLFDAGAVSMDFVLIELCGLRRTTQTQQRIFATNNNNFVVATGVCII